MKLHDILLAFAGLSMLCCGLQASEADASGGQACNANGVCTIGKNEVRAKGAKEMWAVSRLFTDAPALTVEKWLTDQPDLKDKFVLIEFWRTWCGACKRMTPLMNTLHQKFGQELVVIALTGENEEQIKNFKGPKKEYFLALDKPLPKTKDDKQPANQVKTNADAPDTAANPDQGVHPDQGAYEAFFGVWGWPHVIILEPEHHTVIWEGFPGQKGYELTEAKIAKILAIGRKTRVEEK